MNAAATGATPTAPTPPAARPAPAPAPAPAPPSAPRVPPLGASLLGVARLHARVAFGARRLALPIVVGLLVVAAALTARLTGQRPIHAFDLLVGWGALLVFPGVCGLLLAAGAWGLEVEGRTITYLLLRPVPRPAILAGKLLAVALLVAALETALIGAVWFLTWSKGGTADVVAGLPHLARALAAGLLGALSFTALFGALGVAFGARAFTAGAVWLLAVEGVLSVVGAGARYVSLAFHLRVIAAVAGEPGPFAAWSSTLAIVGLGAAWLAAALVLAGAREHERTGGGSE